MNKLVEHYPQCQRCEGNPSVLRRKKSMVEDDFQKKKKKVYIRLINVEKIIKSPLP